MNPIKINAAQAERLADLIAGLDDIDGGTLSGDLTLSALYDGSLHVTTGPNQPDAVIRTDGSAVEAEY